MKLDAFARDPKKSLLLILGVSLAMKLILIGMTDIINPDAVRYINSAHELLQGNLRKAFEHEKMLGFTFLLGLVHLVVPDWFLAGKLLSAFALIMTSIPLYLLSRNLFGARAALASGLMFSVLPYFNELVTEILKGPLFLLCITTSLWLVLRGLQPGAWRDLFAGGLFALLSMLFRVEGIVYLTVAVAVLTVFVCVGPNRRLQLRSLIAFSAMPALVASVGAVAIYFGGIPSEIMPQLQGRFGYYFSLNLLENYQAIYQHLKNVEDQFPGGQVSNDFFELARHQMPLIYMLGLLRVFAKAIFPILLVPLAFGLVLRGRWSHPLILLLSVILGFLLMNYLYLVDNNFISSRYIMVPVIFSLVLAGHGVDRLLDVFSSLRYARLATGLVLLLCLVIPAVESFAILGHEKTVLKTAGEWLEQQQDLERLQFITNDERIAFYAGLMRGTYKVYPKVGDFDYEETALRHDCDLIVLELPKDDSEKLPGFHQFKLLEEFTGHRKKILIYERTE